MKIYGIFFFNFMNNIDGQLLNDFEDNFCKVQKENGVVDYLYFWQLF